MTTQPCTHPDCENPTTGTYLCRDCTTHLQQLLDQVTETRQTLYTTMCRQDQTSPANQPTKGSRTTGSPMPLDDEAMSMRRALAIWEHRDANELARDQHAGNFEHMLKDLLARAWRLVDNPADTRIYGTCDQPLHTGEHCQWLLTGDTHAPAIICRGCQALHATRDLNQRTRERTRGNPMPMREVRQEVHNLTGAHVTGKDIENWAIRGALPYVLERVTTTKKTLRLYYPGDVYRAYFEKRHPRLSKAA
ncbi:hypothetical protein [Zhihengliuella flava]|uniref:Uncharacterized protein n=1 Tax=Zhihengliuella flava TaxID=1285193 RepID=A0A931GK77_9MICC|nr:hypothetical protein [Zhihengliuella flava]MBG6083254.1 hypothetical protein [Zhihengliuella flava]